MVGKRVMEIKKGKMKNIYNIIMHEKLEMSFHEK